MKKILALLLAAVMCLSLVACGGGNDTPSTNDNNANNTSQENENSTTDNIDYEPVEITLDNWQDYFEVVEVPVWEENAFGEIDSFNLEYEFRLKEEYYPRLNAEASNIVIEISYSYGKKPCKVDFENLTYELGERLRTETTTNITDKFYDHNGRFFTNPFGITSYDPGTQEVRYYDDVEMLRIQGTLYLTAEQ